MRDPRLTLHSLVDWPLDVGAPLIALDVPRPARPRRRAPPTPRRTPTESLVHLFTTLGTVAIVAGAYLLAVRGFDKAPTTHSDRDLLWWAMAAAAVAAVAQLALRGRFTRIATSFTYGAREAPDEVVRSFGTRMTRAIPMDELLLQLVESLRKTLIARFSRDLHRQRRGPGPRGLGPRPCRRVRCTSRATSDGHRARWRLGQRLGVGLAPVHRHERR